VPEYYKKRVLILGVGNILFGDDGFGPSAVEYMLKNCEIPEDVYVMDVGIGSGDILFNISLSQTRPEKIIILDAVDMKKKPGTVFQLSIDDLPNSKLSDFSMHFFPSANILKKLQEQMRINIIIIACQAVKMPDCVSVGLSAPVQASLRKAAETALRLARKN
jgi:coenzyme F420 hydrogenase subunit delta